MKFTVSINDKRVRTLFKFSCDYLDVYVNRGLFILFAEETDLFAALTLNVNTMQDYTGEQTFRIPKAGFFSLLQEGVVSFLCEEDTIYVQIKNTKVSHSMKFERQICNTLKLEDKLALMRNAVDYPQFSVADLILPAKILKNSMVPLTIENKIAFVSLGGLQLYAKVKSSDCALFPSTLDHLLAVCNGDFENVYNVKDTIIYSDGSSNVIISKATPNAANDINHIMAQKSVYKATVDFEQAIQLLVKIRSYEEIDLNLRRQELILKSKGVEYSTRIFVTREKEAELSIEDMLNQKPEEIPLIKFPAEVFTNIIYAAKSKSLDIICTENRVRVSIQKGLMFVCRKEVAE